jgi:subfamily B ATP-binding cassette protein MsbA
VSGEKRKDFRRFLTAALALASVASIYYHVHQRDSATNTAAAEVIKVQSGVSGSIRNHVLTLKERLKGWDPSAPDRGIPEGFEHVLVQEGEIADPVLQKVKPTPPIPDPDRPAPTVSGEEFFVHLTSSDKSQEKQGRAFLQPGVEHATNISFDGQGPATIEVKARLAAPLSPGETARPAEVEVLFRRGNLPTAEPLRRKRATDGPLVPTSADLDAVRTFVTGEVKWSQGGRNDLVLRIPEGAPPVSVQWKAILGDVDAKGPQLVIGLHREVPARRVKRTLEGNIHDEMRRWIGRLEERVAGGTGTDEEKAADRKALEDLRTALALAEERQARGLPPDPVVVEVREEARRVFVKGFVSLEKEILDSCRPTVQDLRTPDHGGRLYVTDASGTVVAVHPDYPEKIRARALEARRSLSSVATQLVKVGNGGTRVYEGFAKERVVGAFGVVDLLNGAVIVEQEEKRILAPYRGLQLWHFFTAAFGFLLLLPLARPVIEKIREDTELPRLLAHARPFVPHIAAIVAAAALYAVGTGIFGYQAKVVTDEVLVSEEGAAFGRLSEICWVLAFVAAGMFVFSWAKEYLGKLIQNRLIIEIRCTLCEKVAHLPMSFHAKQKSGDLLSRILNDVSETNRGLEMLFGDIISDPIIILSCIATAFVVNWRLALVVFVGMPVILVPISYFGRAVKRYARKRQVRRAEVTHTIHQMLSGIRVVKAFRMEDHEARRIREVSGSFLVEAMKVARAQVTGKEFLEFFSNLSSVVVMAVGGYFVLERQVSLGDLTAFTFLIARMYRSSKSLAGNYNKMQESLAGTERIFEIIDTPDTMADRPGARALLRPREEISFERVSFRYAEDGPWVLRDLNLRVPVGSSVAFVGATGAGKSTLLDLVARFYDPQEGRVAIDGVDLRDYSRDSLLAQVAVVTQEPFLFNASIAENLRYGKPGAPQTEVEAAARAAFIHDEIVRQPDGYDTVVGERGTRLSGGQRQRVTIARAILKDPPILLLDEATSALDSSAEQKVQEALGNLMRSRTTFVIAHRLSTIQGVDRIVVLEGGTIVEQGTHEELVAIPNGHYRRLYEIQFASALQRDRGDRPGPGAAVAAG